MNYNIISSSSKGNAIVIRDVILIDCGVSFKQLAPVYKNLKLVLLTHIHSDHFNKVTIKRLAKERPTLRFACCEWLVENLIKCGVDKRNIDILQIGIKYDYKAFKIVPIKLYHDAQQCGYRVLFNDYKVFYATDTKTLDGISAKDYDLYLIEANYTEEEMQERIRKKQEENVFAYEFRAKENHLSKEKADEFLLKNMENKSEYIYMHKHIER